MKGNVIAGILFAILILAIGINIGQVITPSPTPDFGPRPEHVVEPYGAKNGTPPPVASPTPIAWTEAEKRIIEAIQQIAAVNGAQNEAIGMLINHATTSRPGVAYLGEQGIIDLGTSNTLHAGPKGGFELKARK